MRVTPARLTAHWRQLRERMHLHCFYVGNADGEVLRSTLCDVLEKNLTGNGAALPAVVSATFGHRETRDYEEELPVGQGQLVMGFRSGVSVADDRFYACTLFNELLGTSPVSKLFMNVRERLSLCYSCNSVYNIYKGAITVSCGLENGNRERAQAEVMRQIKAIADGEITDEEWLAAKKSLENAYRQLEDSPAALESFYFGRALANVPSTLADCRARFDAVTRADVIDVAKRLSCDTVFFLRHTGCGEEVADEED